MKILMTGGSSFTGLWFARALAARGHTLVAPLLRPLASYSGLRGQRVAALADAATLVEECPFGSDSFLALIEEQGPWELLCHHAAEVTDYKSASFDPLAAVAKNSYRCEEVIAALKNNGCRHLLLTGSVFEQREGRGTDNLRAVSPYGLSKGITSDLFSYRCAVAAMTLGKFVIPNPFGPYEEERFTAFLMCHWLEGKEAVVAFPDYLRDNIHATLLAEGYASFAEQLVAAEGPFYKLNPSGYVGTQGEFTARFAEAMRPRLGLPCAYRLEKQTLFTEPKERYNSDKLEAEAWNESEAWDAIAAYYKEKVCQQ